MGRLRHLLSCLIPSCMKKIQLSRGYEATVDNCDYATALAHKWSTLLMKSKNHQQIYATTNINKSKAYLHREIMKQILTQENRSTSLIKHRIVAFKNGNSLDCRRDNLILLPPNRKLRQR